ncbi:hypothetical protein [Magnetospira sp. QH-2]|uniref:hypothetical protein n=1 Tax=Magnetospira sp. (strain QH-2) TaxID=1288970 RepID=UPI0003E81129|nr:hypothetical protein [Magnetospira sp. QH-2]CCQ75421.1 protein of unknown function [Magnetospira sp. QH-2]
MNRSDFAVVPSESAPDCGGVEVPLDQLLAGTVMRAMMSSDGVRREDLEALLDDVRHKISEAA